MSDKFYMICWFPLFEGDFFLIVKLFQSNLVSSFLFFVKELISHLILVQGSEVSSTGSVIQFVV